MVAPIVETNEWKSSRYDMVVDVRSPCEFSNDHIPEAVNLPVLSDSERSEVGRIYKQQSSFNARRKGAALVARNIAHHLEKKLEKMGPGFTPLVYCWRGGQRSAAFAQICSEVGWQSFILKGGYKSYRQAVLLGFKQISSSVRFIVIAGRTGSGKTNILDELKLQGAQILDLEKLAVHRGSLLGKIKDREQPSQRMFESNLYSELLKFNFLEPIYVESESSRIGNIQIPVDVWKQVVSAPMISITMQVSERAKHLLSQYRHLMSDPSALEKLVSGMIHRHGHARTTIWRELIKAKDWQNLAEDLLNTHYDPAYDKSTFRHNRRMLAEIKQKDCCQKTLKATADLILGLSGRPKLKL